MIVKLHLIGEIAVDTENQPNDPNFAISDARQQLENFREAVLPGQEYGISIFENPELKPVVDPEDEEPTRLAQSPAPNPDDLIASLLARLGQAVRYLEHPDVAAMPFAVRSEVLARQSREAMDAANAYLRGKRS